LEITIGADLVCMVETQVTRFIFLGQKINFASDENCLFEMNKAKKLKL
jgi:hypothetical protein